MRYPGRLAAAIEILDEIAIRHRPAAEAVRDWGRIHRFAGSGDRAAIASRVHDVLRSRASLAWQMESEDPRSLVLASALEEYPAEQLAELFSGDPHAPDALTASEIATWDSRKLELAPDWVRANIPEWLAGEFQKSLGQAWIEEGSALAARAPLDMRINTLKADCEKMAQRFSRFGAVPTAYSPIGLRISADRRHQKINLNANPDYQRGRIEVQDEGSQIAALLSGARAGEQILDYCAGAGGKTLAISAAMENRGQIYAYDRDPLRMRDIYGRIRRAGTRNIQILDPEIRQSSLVDLRERIDRVIVDAPCSGSGAWRRRPDSKWRLNPDLLEQRRAGQVTALAQAAEFVRPSGRLLYVTCSVLATENEGSIAEFLEHHPQFTCKSIHDRAADLLRQSLPTKSRNADGSALLTPLRTETDGFFIAELVRV